jgi:hypothetical protein
MPNDSSDISRCLSALSMSKSSRRFLQFSLKFDEEAIPTFNTDRRPAYVEETIMSVCSSLIAIVDRGGHQVVQFSHFSVKGYLTSGQLAVAEERLSYSHFLPKPIHTILVHISLNILLHLDDKIDDRDTIAHFPLAPYAAQHQFRNISSQIKKVMKHLFDPANSHFTAWSGYMTSTVTGRCTCPRCIRRSPRLCHFIMPLCAVSLVSQCT